MTNSSVFFNIEKDLKILENKKLNLPEHVLILNQNFGEFKSP